MTKMKETIVQTEESLNDTPRIEVQDAFIKEIEIRKELLIVGDISSKPVYNVKIRIMDATGGRHEVTTVGGLCKGDLEVRI